MEITYTPHAVERMIQKQIAPSDVEILVAEPDGRIRQSHDKVIYYRNFKGRSDNALAAVVVQIRHNYSQVITVMVNFQDPG